MRQFLAVLAAAFVIAVFAPAATADQPVVNQYPVSGQGILNDFCSFPITVDFSANVVEKQFYDKSGALTRIEAHWIEQDRFSANENSLLGAPFQFHVKILFDSSGAITHLFAEGVIEKVPLPDGSLFITAGRVDFAAHGFPPFMLTPDNGATVNLEGFCAALAP